MVARNDITGDAIQTKGTSEAFRSNYDAIFRKDKVTPKVENMKKGTCGCGRSPTGDCIGWHGLTEDAYKQALEQYNINEVSKLVAEETLQATDADLEAYKKQAQELWSDSCTTGRSE